MKIAFSALLTWLAVALAPHALATTAASGPFADADGDGVQDFEDLCANTATGSRVWTSGSWIGCAGGQYLTTTDQDQDGVTAQYDKCGGTNQGASVHLNEAWLGCAAGQYQTASSYAPVYTCGSTHRTCYGHGYRYQYPRRMDGYARWRCLGDAARKINGCAFR